MTLTSLVSKEKEIGMFNLSLSLIHFFKKNHPFTILFFILYPKYTETPWIDFSATSLWIDHALTYCTSKMPMQLLGILCWLFWGTVSTISVCKSIFFCTPLQSVAMPFDPSPEAYKAV